MEATPVKKKKYKHLIIGGIILVIVIVAIIAWTRPFVWQKRAWLNKNTKPSSFSVTVANMSDAQVEAAYCIWKKYNGDPTKASAAMQSTYATIAAATQA